MDRETIEEIKRHFNVALEGTDRKIGLLAEALASFREETRREFVAVREEIDEVKAMIRLSYRELDGRLRSLETDVSELRSRLERVEARVGN